MTASDAHNTSTQNENEDDLAAKSKNRRVLSPMPDPSHARNHNWHKSISRAQPSMLSCFQNARSSFSRIS